MEMSEDAIVHKRHKRQGARGMGRWHTWFLAWAPQRPPGTIITGSASLLYCSSILQKEWHGNERRQHDEEETAVGQQPGARPLHGTVRLMVSDDHPYPRPARTRSIPL